MSGVDGIRAGRAYVELGTNNNPFIRGLTDSSRRMRDWASGIGDVVRGVGDAFRRLNLPKLSDLTRDLADAGVLVGKLRKQTGMSAEAIAGLKKAGEDAELPFADLVKMMTKLQVNIADPTKEITAAFRALGMSVKDVQKAPFADVISKISDRLPGLEPNRREAIAQDLFGRGGEAIVPVFEGGSDGLERATKEAKSLGLVFTDEDLKRAEEYDAVADDLKAKTDALRMAMGRLAIEGATNANEEMSKLLETVRQMTLANKELAKSFAEVWLKGEKAAPWIAAGLTVAANAAVTAAVIGRRGGGGLGGAGAGAAAVTSAASRSLAVDGATGTVLKPRPGMIARGAGFLAKRALPVLGAVAVAADAVDAFTPPIAGKTGGLDPEEVSKAERERMIRTARAEQGLDPLVKQQGPQQLKAVQQPPAPPPAPPAAPAPPAPSSPPTTPSRSLMGRSVTEAELDRIEREMRDSVKLNGRFVKKDYLNKVEAEMSGTKISDLKLDDSGAEPEPHPDAGPIPWQWFSQQDGSAQSGAQASPINAEDRSLDGWLAKFRGWQRLGGKDFEEIKPFTPPDVMEWLPKFRSWEKLGGKDVAEIKSFTPGPVMDQLEREQAERKQREALDALRGKDAQDADRTFRKFPKAASLPDPVQRKTEALGTFHAVAAERLGFGTSIEQRQTKGIEETASNTRGLLLALSQLTSFR